MLLVARKSAVSPSKDPENEERKETAFRKKVKKCWKRVPSASLETIGGRETRSGNNYIEPPKLLALQHSTVGHLRSKSIRDY
jgi:hypothetical protein